jgi:hypothetical protein
MRRRTRSWSGAASAALGLPRSPFVQRRAAEHQKSRCRRLPLEAVPSLTNSTKNGTYP